MRHKLQPQSRETDVSNLATVLWLGLCTDLPSLDLASRDTRDIVFGFQTRRYEGELLQDSMDTQEVQ